LDLEKAEQQNVHRALTFLAHDNDYKKEMDRQYSQQAGKNTLQL